MTEPPVVFCSYSHRDEDLKDRLDAHLSALRRECLIQRWHDRKILPGADWKTEINDVVAQADVVLILVSADFIASEYCWGVEFTKALERHDRGEAAVLPIIVRPCDWQNTQVGRLQVLPQDGRAVTTWPNRDQAWTEVARGLRSVLQAAHLGAPKPLTPSMLIEFAHIGVRPDRDPRWKEFGGTEPWCPFGGGCDQYFNLDDFTFNADLFLDVVLLNNSRRPAVLSAVGVHIEQIKNVRAGGGSGISKPFKIAPAIDEYEVPMPNLGRLKFDPTARIPMTVSRRVLTRLPDPIYLPSRAPYR